MDGMKWFGYKLGSAKRASKALGIPLEEYVAHIDAGKKWCSGCKAWHFAKNEFYRPGDAFCKKLIRKQSNERWHKSLDEIRVTRSIERQIDAIISGDRRALRVGAIRQLLRWGLIRIELTDNGKEVLKRGMMANGGQQC